MWFISSDGAICHVTVFIAGAHSHIRGLGLDDALEPRSVSIYNSIDLINK